MSTWWVGKYMCAPGDIKPASINLHVLEGQLQGVQSKVVLTFKNTELMLAPRQRQLYQ